MPRTRPRGCYLSPIRDACFEIPQPIFIDAHGWTMPGAFAAGFEGPHGEIGDEALATVMQRPRAKGLGGCGRGVVEIVLRRRRVVFAFAAEEAANVAPVFAQERVALVFRMALKKYEQGTSLRPGKRVDPRRALPISGTSHTGRPSPSSWTGRATTPRQRSGHASPRTRLCSTPTASSGVR
jgi:hypothetical protein